MRYNYDMTDDEFIDHHGSGTLRKNKRLGFMWRDQYVAERVSFEFGHAFEAVQESRLTLGAPMTEGDCKPLTEAGWFIDRYLSVCLRNGIDAKAVYIAIDDGNERREGVGIWIVATLPSWIPRARKVVAVVSSRVGNGYATAINPC